MILAAVEVVIEPPGTPWWVPWLSVASAISLFVLGFLFSPFGKAREALFQEQRHNRRRFQHLAHDVMGRLKESSRKFDSRTAPHFAHKALDFRDLLQEHKYELHPVDRAVCARFIAAIFLTNKATDPESFALCVNEVYDRYLDLRHPARRWLRRHMASKEYFAEIERKDFVPPREEASGKQIPGLVDASAEDVSH